MNYLIAFFIIAALAALVIHFKLKEKRLAEYDNLANPYLGPTYRAPAFIGTLYTLGLMLWKKGALILVALVLMQTYAKQEGMPFAELLYLVNVAFSIVVTGFVIRFLFFPEVAEFAEDAKRFDTAVAGGTYPTALRHYWFGTAISFFIPTAAAIAVF